MTDQPNEIESDSDTLALLEPIMRRWEVWPARLSIDDEYGCSYIGDMDHWYDIADRHALAIVLFAAEDYLTERGWEIGRRGSVMWWTHPITWPIPSTAINSLATALEHAEKMGRE